MKKAISPVVGVSLLIVVAVVAVLGFASWYNSYQSGITTNVEKKDSLGGINIDRIEYNGTSNTSVFVRNTGVSAVNITSVTLRTDGVTQCTNTTTYQVAAQALLEAKVTDEDCSLVRNTDYEVVLVTPEGVFVETLVYK